MNGIDLLTRASDSLLNVERDAFAVADCLGRFSAIAMHGCHGTFVTTSASRPKRRPWGATHALRSALAVLLDATRASTSTTTRRSPAIWIFLPRADMRASSADPAAAEAAGTAISK